MENVETSFRRMISRSFPSNARIINVPRQAEIVFAISWRLHWQFPNAATRSRTIRLAISDDIVDQYETAPAIEKRITEGKVTSVLKQMLADFDPVPCQSAEGSEVVAWQLALESAPLD